MFGHLDDPQPHDPTARDRIAVGRKAARYRRRRRVAAAGALVIALVTTVAVTSVVVGGGTNSGRETAFAFNQSPVVSVDAPVPTTALEDVVFIDVHQGFGLADHRNRLVLASTVDGGQSWTVVTAKLPLSDFGSSSAQLEFTDPLHGYLWGASAGTSQPQTLWTTADGGTTWREAPLSTVSEVSAIEGNVWALSQACEPGATICQVMVDESTDFGVHWQQQTVGPIAAGGSVELARITKSSAYVLLEGAPAPAPFYASIEYTSDSGSTWSSRAVPCGPDFQFGTELAASGTDDLWLVCGGQGAAGSQYKQLFRSSDGGSTWGLAAQTSAPALLPSVGTLPLGGYVAPYAIGHKTLEVLSPQLAWLQPYRNDVVTSTDGGGTWSPVTDLQVAGFGTGAPGNLTFISATQGWVCELGVGLWHTDDGLHWSPLGA